MDFIICFAIIAVIALVSAIVRFGNIHLLRRNSSVFLKKDVKLDDLVDKLAFSIKTSGKAVEVSEKNSLCGCIMPCQSKIYLPPLLKNDPTISTIAFVMFKTAYDDILAKKSKKSKISGYILAQEQMLAMLSVLLILASALIPSSLLLCVGTGMFCVISVFDLLQIPIRMSACKTVMKYCKDNQLLADDEKDAFCGIMTALSFSSLACFADMFLSAVGKSFKAAPRE